MKVEKHYEVYTVGFVEAPVLTSYKPEIFECETMEKCLEVIKKNVSEEAKKISEEDGELEDLTFKEVEDKGAFAIIKAKRSPLIHVYYFLIRG